MATPAPPPTAVDAPQPSAKEEQPRIVEPPSPHLRAARGVDARQRRVQHVGVFGQADAQGLRLCGQRDHRRGRSEEQDRGQADPRRLAARQGDHLLVQVDVQADLSDHRARTFLQVRGAEREPLLERVDMLGLFAGEFRRPGGEQFPCERVFVASQSAAAAPSTRVDLDEELKRVFDGATRAYQDTTCASGKPASAKVGTSGRSFTRVGEATARARSDPLATWPRATEDRKSVV